MDRGGVYVCVCVTNLRHCCVRAPSSGLIPGAGAPTLGSPPQETIPLPTTTQNKKNHFHFPNSSATSPPPPRVAFHSARVGVLTPTARRSCRLAA